MTIFSANIPPEDAENLIGAEDTRHHVEEALRRHGPEEVCSLVKAMRAATEPGPSA
jgi:hypothetical protein